MDIYCTVCSEPLDTDEIHALRKEDPDLAEFSWTELVGKFAQEGCRALNLRCNKQGEAAPSILKEGYAMLDGDPDAQASMASDVMRGWGI